MELRSGTIIPSGKKWIICEWQSIQEGDYIRATTTTYSQLWLIREGNPNQTIYGHVEKCGDVEELLLRTADGIVAACKYVGSSGYHTLARLE